MIFLHTEKINELLPLLARKPAPSYGGRNTGRVLALNPDASSCGQAMSWGYNVIGRAEGPWDGTGWQQITPSQWADAMVGRLPLDDLYGITLPNEPNDGDAYWMAQAVREIRQRRPHLMVYVGQWANGHDGFPIPVDPQDLDHIVYSSHSYGRPDKPEMVMYQSDWLALRHRRWWPAVLAVQPNARFAITEFGCTEAAPDFENGGAVGDDIGYLDRPGFDFDRYWASCVALDQAEPEVDKFLYEFGAHPKWETMDGLGTPLEDKWVAYQPAPTEPPEPPIGGDEMPEFVLGFADLAAELGTAVVGHPQVDEKTLKNPDGSNVLTVQMTDKGMMVYMDGAQPLFLPALT
jgi:hypothetical protein